MTNRAEPVNTRALRTQIATFARKLIKEHRALFASNAGEGQESRASSRPFSGLHVSGVPQGSDRELRNVANLSSVR